MEYRKSIGKLSDEDLFSLLNSLPEKASKTKTSDSFLLFLETFNFQPGEVPVKFDILYTLYNAWSSEPISKGKFGRRMTEIFESRKQMYFINTDVMTLSKEAYKLLNKKKRNKATGEKNQRHFENFLIKFNIKPGKSWIKLQELYLLYASWAKKNNKQNPLGRTNFTEFCKIYFDTRKNKSSFEFAINEDFLKESRSEEENPKEQKGGRETSRT